MRECRFNFAANIISRRVIPCAVQNFVLHKIVRRRYGTARVCFVNAIEPLVVPCLQRIIPQVLHAALRTG